MNSKMHSRMVGKGQANVPGVAGEGGGIGRGAGRAAAAGEEHPVRRAA